MILIMSTARGEVTSSVVMDWIRHLGGRCERLNGEDLGNGSPYALHVANERASFSIELDGREVPLDDVGAVFYRGRASTPTSPPLPSIADPRLRASIAAHMHGEQTEVTQGTTSWFDGASWTPHRSAARLDKITGMLAARASGLEIPPTLVTSSRQAARAFVEAHRDVIVKTFGNGVLRGRDDNYMLYTSRVEVEDLLSADGPLFPCLLQAYVPKEYEIRTFYLDGQCDSMGIFSQLDPQTTVDFRQYNWKRYNRCVPVRLPATVVEAVVTFMSRIGLSTGSLDLIKRPDGRYVFLEVNPVGQFGFVSTLCNFQLEKKVALHLMAQDGQSVTDGRRNS
jgi:hypothetical protein